MAKRKRKRNKYEEQFIKDHGIELYHKMRWAFPELKYKPKTWQFVPGLAEVMARNAPFKCTVKDMYEGWTADYEEDR